MREVKWNTRGGVNTRIREGRLVGKREEEFFIT